MAMRAASETLYREVRPPARLSDDLVCSWVGSVGPDGPPTIDRVLPDGCVDVVWNGERLFVAGPDETAVALERQPGSTIVGVRLMPGRAPALLRTAANELTGLRVDLTELWGCEAGEIAARLEETSSAEAARRLLEWRVAVRVAQARAADAAIAALVWALAADARTGIVGLAHELGLSRRQLQRRSLVELGYGPKTFARIMRFQRFVGLGRHYPEAQLVALARSAGLPTRPTSAASAAAWPG
jgi:hypothetical protein